ncbi:MAG: hypothetical protein J6P05_02540 [Lachnospiraceae bacterium]|nr:hypothetical protein [Lachnospiraceae bacterium]
MTYYIGAELGKAFKSKAFKYYIAGIVAVCLLANLAMSAFRNIIYGMNDGTFAYNLIMFAEGFFWVPYYSCIFIADIVFGESCPDPRIRDKSTIGLGRSHIYFGKFFAELILLGIYSVMALVSFLVITPIFQVHDGTIDFSVISEFVYTVVLAMPLIISGLAISNMFLFSCKTKKSAYGLFILCVIILPRVIMLLATDSFHVPIFVTLEKVLITPQFQTLQFYATRDVPKIIITSIIYITAALTIGCINYNRREF